MENWDDQQFKSEWKKAFEGAEATPSDQVWANIDARMMATENANMKKRVAFYQRLAAASVGVMLFVSGYAFFTLNDNEPDLAVNKTRNKKQVDSEVNTNTTATSPHNQNTKSAASVDQEIMNQATEEGMPQNVLAARSIKSGSSSVSLGKDTLESTTNSISTIYPNSVVQASAKVVDALSDALNLKLIPAKLSPPMPKEAKLDNLAIAYRLADARPAVRKKKKDENSHESSWASLGFAAGNFSNNASNLDLLTANRATSSVSAPFFDSQSNASKTEETKPGSSYSMSVSGGKRLAKRWLMQGGLSYMNQSSRSNTSTVLIEQAFKTTNSIAPENINAVTSTEESEINSTFQFISLPVQAGYMLVDQKFGIQLNAGLSPDVFLKSTVSDKASSETINTTGSNSTFKTVSLSGLGGVEVSYRFSEHYRISLVPGFRYSLTPVYKDNSLASAKPFVADIGLRFRYVF